MIIKQEKLLKINSFKTIVIFIICVLMLFISLFLYYFYFFPTFSPFSNFQSGLYNDKISIELSSFIPNSEIRYTLDNSEPTVNSNIYFEKIYIDKDTVLRAKNFRNSNPIGSELVLSFLYPRRSISLPIVNLILDPVDLYDPITGIYHNNNFDKRGEEWHRDGYFTLFSHPSGIKEIISGEKVDIRIYGNKSREFPRKSFKVCFKDNNVNFKIFNDSNITNFSCILLRNSGNDWNSTLFKDALVHKIVSRNSNIYTQNSQPIILYLNNEYFGIYNIREFISASTLSVKYGGSSNDYAVLFPVRAENGKLSVESGTNSDVKLYEELQQLSKNLDNPVSKKRFEELIDIDEFIDYHVFQTYFENFDYNDQNTKSFRYNGFIKYPDSKRDGKFRWLLYDTDGTFGSLTKRFSIFNVMNGLRDSENRKWPYVLYKNTFAFPEYKEKYINRYTYFLNTIFRSEYIDQSIDEFKNKISNEVPYHIKRWEDFQYYDKNRRDFVKPLKNYEDWLVEVEKLKAYNSLRNILVYNELDESFKFGGFYDLEVQNNFNSMGYVEIQGIKIKDKRWSGKFFNYQTLDIKAVPYKDFEFVSWEVNTKNLKSPVFRKKLP